ncbi:OmpA family protein [Actinoplanes sp. CA-252034]|uniref:OmpA family protein n=1 Tax=Actinoplanes sp. CA-252034 TaxID=3239906 RepID=UPI003D95B019
MSRAAGRWIAAPIALLGLAAILTAQLGPNRDRIENDLTRRATAALAAAGQTGARVSFTGRDGLIVTSEADAVRARSIVEGVTGVRAVTTHAIPAAAPSTATAATPREVVTLAEDVRATVDLMLLREQLAVVPPLLFGFGGAEPTADSRAALRKAAALLADHPDARIRIEGHTDAQGSKTTNLQLSRERAEAVRDTLRELGVAADRMTAIGYGEARPAAPNDTAGHRAANRRVELALT